MTQRLQNTSSSPQFWQKPIVQGAAAALTIGAIAVGRGRLRYANEVQRLAKIMSNTHLPYTNDVPNTRLETLINQSIASYPHIDINADIKQANKKIEQMRTAIQSKIDKNQNAILTPLEQTRLARKTH